MSAETISRKNTEYEPEHDRELLPIISYEEYREFCDAAQPDIYRKAGIDGRENFEAAQNNPDTIFIEKEGRRLPLFVALESAGGYNVEGTHGLTDRQHVLALALPVDVLSDEELIMHLEAVGEDTAIVVQTARGQTNEVKENLAVLQDIGWHVGDFLDPRCPEGRKTASMSIYSTALEARSEDGELLPFRDRSLKELYEEDARETGQTNTVLVTAQEIRDDEELFNQLWELHNDRFDWLGEYHPVSMQETKDFFKQVVSNDHTTSFIRFDDESGNRIPVCHGCFVDDLDLVDWINDRYKQDIIDQATANDEKVQFFFGIVSSAKTSAHYAKDVMSLHARIDQRNGGKIRLLFESTNKSSLYIPRMVQSYTAAEPNGVKLVEEVESIAQLDYWYLASELSKTV